MRTRLAALLAALLLGGCASLPTTGPVETHSPRASQPSSGVAITPEPPFKGASPSLIVEGFLQAMSTYQPDYGVARQFLTPAANQLWRPERGADVYAEGNTPLVTGDGVVLVAPLAGRLSADGTYAQTTGQLRHDFGLVRDDSGEWRISHPPEGLLISHYLFAASYTRATLYFYEPQMRWLVPDVRFVPNGLPGLTLALRRLLEGPGAWLAPATTTVPMKLMEVPRVTVDGAGLVDVELNDAAAAGSDLAREQLVGQLVWTLRSFDQVTGLRVRTAGQVWSYRVAEAQGRVTLDSFPELDPTDARAVKELFALANGRLARVTEVRSEEMLAEIAPDYAGMTLAAVSPDGQEVAALWATGGVLRMGSVSGAPSAPAVAGVELVRPQFSRHQELWTVSGDRLQVWRDGQPVPVSSSLPPLDVAAFRLSSDASRLALVGDLQGRRVLGVARVVHAGDRIAVDGWRELTIGGTASPATQVLDVGWVSEVELAALISDQGITSVMVLDQDGAASVDVGPNQVKDLVELAVAPGAVMMVRSASGQVYRYRTEFNWWPYLTAVSAICYAV